MNSAIRLATTVPAALIGALLVVVMGFSTVGFAQETSPTPVFKRGDFNGDSVVDVADPTATLFFLFGAGPASRCADAGDVNDDGELGISDAVFSLFHLFIGGPEPAAPGFQCGPDPSEDALDCEQYAPCGFVPADVASPLLKQAETCEEVEETLRAELLENMETILDENLQTALDLLEQLSQRGGCGWWFLGADDVFDAAGPPEAGRGAEAPEEFTETNNQVAGVDEADFVKTDGGHIYILADGQLQIIDAWPPEQAHRVSAVELEGTPRKLFVYGDRALVYSSLGLLHQPPADRWGPWGGPIGFPVPRSVGECTYGYDCEFTGDGRRLEISVFDISDRAAPTLLREIEFSGSFLNARRIGAEVYTVVTFPEVSVPDLSYWPDELRDYWRYCWEDIPFPFDEEQIRAMFEALRDRNRTLIEEATLADFLPSITDTRHDGDTPTVIEEILTDCDNFFIAPTKDGRSLLSVVQLGIDTLEDVESATVVGRPGAVYASHESLYVATRHHRRDVEGPWFFSDPDANPEATTVHKFSLGDTEGPAYNGSGVVKGRVLNQFSMDEYQDHLRIATTTGRVPNPDVHSTVATLTEIDGELLLVGLVDNIAPTEDIRSVRFDGEVGFVVTFKKTDPLFVIDLADPEFPVIRSELKIPGYSTYMHLLDDGHLLSIGYDADDQGDFAWFQGILLQIIDVSDLDHPALIHREVIGTRGSTSEAATNHLAFNFFRSRGLLGVPITVCEDSTGGGAYGRKPAFSGLQVYRVDVGSGFELVGGVPHELDESGFHCGNWWTRSNSIVKRSIFMDDYVFSVALDQINVSGIDDLGSPLATIPLEE